MYFDDDEPLEQDTTGSLHLLMFFRPDVFLFKMCLEALQLLNLTQIFCLLLYVSRSMLKLGSHL